MRTYHSYLFFGILLAFICCKKDYYLEDLKQAEKEHAALSNTLIQISVSNNQLLRGNQDLNLKIEDLLSKNEMNLSEAEAQIQFIETLIEETSIAQAESFKKLIQNLNIILLELREYGSKNQELEQNINALIHQIEKKRDRSFDSKNTF